MELITQTGIEAAEFRKQPALDRYLPAVDAHMSEFLQETTGIHSLMVDYHMGLRDQEGSIIEGNSGGKALRPALCLLTADALSGDWKLAVPAATALELFHNFTLIHDDIQDGDLKRRDKPTVWAIHGAAQGINAGDALHIVSSLAMSDLRRKGVKAETVLEARDLLDATGLQVVEGQILDVSFENRLDVSVEEYLAMISKKTGILIENSIMMGALFSSVDDLTRDDLRRYGEQLGRAFQISDDILGIWGNPEKTGKPVGSDIVHRKKSLPIAMAFNTDSHTTRKALEEIYTQDKPLLDEQDVACVLNILEDMGVQNQVTEMLDHTHEQAVEAVKQAQLGWAEQDYLTLAQTLSYREK